MWIAVIGPLASLVLAAILGLLMLVAFGNNSPIGDLVKYLGLINLILGLFNLIPAFPLYGDRVLKSLVWKANGSQDKAIAIASFTGSILGFMFIGAGILIAFSTGKFIWGTWLIFIG